MACKTKSTEMPGNPVGERGCPGSRRVDKKADRHRLYLLQLRSQPQIVLNVVVVGVQSVIDGI